MTSSHMTLSDLERSNSRSVRPYVNSIKQISRKLPFVIPTAGVKQSAKVHGPLVSSIYCVRRAHEIEICQSSIRHPVIVCVTIYICVSIGHFFFQILVLVALSICLDVQIPKNKEN